MILCSNYKVKLNKQIRIQYLHYAFNQTFVMLGFINGKDVLNYVDKNGKKIFYYQFDKPVDTLALISDHEAVVLQTRHNRISVLNLQTLQFTYFPHFFMFQEIDQSSIITFPQTKYLCIQQKGFYNNNKYKLTYFQYPLMINNQKQTKILSQYDAKDNQWSYQHLSQRANGHSMIIWYKPRHDDNFDFKTYQIINGKGQLRHYKFNRPIAKQHGAIKNQTLIFSVWQTKKNRFLFLCCANKNATKDKGAIHNDNFIIDLNNNGTISEFQSKFGPYQDQLTDQMSFGAFSMIKTFSIYDEPKSMIYYFDNANQKMMQEQIWQNKYLYVYETEGYMPGLFTERKACNLSEPNYNFEYFQVNVKRVVYTKQLYAFLLYQNNNKINQELIEAVIKLLE